MQDKEFYEQNIEIFSKAIGRKVGKIVKYAILFRFLANVLVNRLNVFKALKDVKSVLQLGLGCGTFNVIYHFIRRFIVMKRKSMNKIGKKSEFWMSKESELVFACSFASLGLSLMPENDMRILKLVIFSRAVVSLVSYIGDSTGWYQPV